MKYVSFVDEDMREDEVGAKFYRQKILRDAGLPVPEYFVLKRNAWEEWNAAGQGGVPQAVWSEVEGVVGRLFEPGQDFAVRGCFVGCEDTDQDAFAGMSDSFLFVSRDELRERIVACWRSAFSERASLYRERCSHPIMPVAVGIQRMIPAEKAFVLFTSDPVSGARRFVVNAAAGDGEELVQGHAVAEHYAMSPDAERIERHGELLSTGELHTLAKLGYAIEKLFGTPQDIEGCFADGRAWIVQARPMVIRGDERVLWNNSNVTESFPGVAMPLTYSFARVFYREVFRDCFRSIGVDQPDLEHDFNQMIGYLQGRIYYRLTTFYRLFSAHPLFPIYRSHWERMIGLDASYETTTPPAPAFSARAVGWVNLAVNALRWRSRLRRTLDSFDRDTSAIESLDIARMGAPALARTARDFYTRSFRSWGVTLVNDIFLILGYGHLSRLAKQRGLPHTIVNDLLCGDDALVSAKIVESAVSIGELLQASADPAEAVRSHLACYGYRGIGDLHLDRAPLGADELLAMARRYAAEGLRVADLRAREREIRAQAEQRLGSIGPIRRAPFRVLLGLVRSAVRLREESRYARSRLFGVCRTLFNAMGARLVEARALAHAKDVHLLSLDELLGAVEGTGVVGDLKELVEVRRRDLERYRAAEMPAHVVTEGAVAGRRWVTRESAALTLEGLGASCGVAVAPARLVWDARKPPDGDFVLVARETDPGWLFLMLASKGIVVERGSMLSHTAITARRFGIPTVVGVSGATRLIKDGDVLEIDGSSGRVRILSHEAAP